MSVLAVVQHDAGWWAARVGGILLSAIIWTTVRRIMNRRRK